MLGTTRPECLRPILAAALLGFFLLPAPADAQYFGRNKVQYEEFDWSVLHTDHFNVHYYPQEEEMVRDLAAGAERWYVRLGRVFGHELQREKPVIFYANHPDFQQTNTTPGFLGEATGGFTESLKNRVVMPLTGDYQGSHHVLGHELVHAFQYDIAQSPAGFGLAGLNRLPGWMIEGMAEYFSIGRHDPHTAMWLRDAALRDELPTIDQLTRDTRFFPYRYGQGLLAYIGGRWGDRTVAQLLRLAGRQGVEPAVRTLFGMSTDSLSREWIRAVRAAYLPLMQGKSPPGAAGTPLVTRQSGAGDMNIAPSLSPDGRFFVFLSDYDLFNVTLFLADAQTGRIIRRVANQDSDPHFDAISYLNSKATWSPDGRSVAYVVYAQGDNQVAISEVQSGRVTRRFSVPGADAIRDLAWSPDGRTLAVSGAERGYSDLFLFDLQDNSIRQLTNDRFAELQPTWSPDGRTLAFVTDRGEGTDFQQLTFGPMRLATIDVASREVTVLPALPGSKHINPQYAPDGQDLYFVGDHTGFSNLYRLSLATGEFFQITDLATGVSGVTDLSPAITVASQAGLVAFSAFENGGFNIFSLSPDQARGTAVVQLPGEVAWGGVLPPFQALEGTLVSDYLADAYTGMPRDTTYLVSNYRPGLQLDFVGPPTVGIGTSQFGTGVAGGASAYFSDLLGNRQLAAAVQANGTFKDVGGQVYYENREGRWAWGVAAAHVPYLTGRRLLSQDQIGNIVVQEDLIRIYVDQLIGRLQYPFTMTRRVELSGGYTHYGYDFETRFFTFDPNSGFLLDQSRQDVESPDGLHFFQAGPAYVGDYSFFGFTSPIRGGRYRFEVEGTVGTLNFVTALADWRRYFFRNPVTLAIRGLHYGRYGGAVDDDRMRPLFLGQEVFVRGYSYESFEVDECLPGGTASTCPVFDRLIGSRIGVASAEVRVPLFGIEQFGLITFPYLPTELSAFVDAGLAWDEEGPDFKWSTSASETGRIPVVSTGVSARVNLLGYLVVEAYYAYPFQRPDRGWHWGFQIAPGW